MAQPASEAREALVELTRITQAEVAEVVAEFRRAGLNPEQTRDALLDLLPALGAEYNLAASALAADWYDDVRDAAEVRGYYRAEPVAPPTPARWEALARWGVDPLFGVAPDWQAATALLAGGLQRSVADGHRLTVVENSLRDPKAAGWQRVGVGDNCGFCRMLIDRGHVYTEASVTFRSHDHCNCAASPSFADNVVKVSTEPFKQSQRNRSDATKRADNARAREFIANI